MGPSINKATFFESFRNGINLHAPTLQKQLSGSGLVELGKKLTELADEHGIISSEKLDSVITLLDSFEVHQSESSLEDILSSGKLEESVDRSTSILRERPGGEHSVSSTSVRKRVGAPPPQNLSSHLVPMGPQAPPSLEELEKMAGIGDMQASRPNLEGPISKERFERILQLQQTFLRDKVKHAKEAPLTDFRRLRAAYNSIQQNPKNYSIAEKRGIEERLNLLMERQDLQDQLASLYQDFLTEYPDIQKEVHSLKEFMRGPEIDKLQTRREHAQGPGLPPPNVYLEQLQTLVKLDPSSADEMLDVMYDKSMANLAKKDPQGFLNLTQGIVERMYDMSLEEMTPEERKAAKEWKTIQDQHFENARNNPNLVISEEESKYHFKKFFKPAKKISRIGSQIGSGKTKTQRPLKLLDSKTFKLGMLGASGYSFSSTEAGFDALVQGLTTANHLVGYYAKKGDEQLKLIEKGVKKNPTWLSKNAHLLSKTGKVLSLTAGVATSIFDGYEAGKDFAKGDVGGGVGKTLVATGGLMLTAPGVGWVPGTVVMASGLAIDFAMGESDQKTNVRQLLERRVQIFAGTAHPPEGYSDKDKARFQEAMNLSTELKIAFQEIEDPYVRSVGLEHLNTILSNGSGIGKDDNLSEMFKHFDENIQYPPFSQDAVMTIEQRLHELRNMKKKLKNGTLQRCSPKSLQESKDLWRERRRDDEYSRKVYFQMSREIFGI